MRTIYLTFGAVLAAFGAVLGYLSYYLLFSVPFAALGIACLILGAAIITLPERVVPSGAVRAVIQSSVLNVEALLEEFDAKERATYLPPKDGLAVAYVPLSSNSHSPSATDLASVSRRLVTEVDGVPVLLVVPPGAELVRAGEIDDGNAVDDALQYVLLEAAELCSSVKSVVTGDTLVIDIGGIKVKTEAAKYLFCLGSIPTSVAASVASTVLKKGLTLLAEDSNDRKSVAKFRVL